MNIDLLEYIKIHLISLEQDWEKIQQQMAYTYENSRAMRDLSMKINVLDHLIKVAEETNER
jgi:hypothetical protein